MPGTVCSKAVRHGIVGAVLLPHHPALLDALRTPSVDDPWRVIVSGASRVGRRLERTTSSANRIRISLHSRRMKSISVAALALVLACGPSVTTQTTGSTSTSEGSSAESTATSDLAIPDLPPVGPLYRAVSAGHDVLCAVREPGGEIVCRDPQCDAGVRPDEWTLDDPACWIAPALPSAEYVQVEVNAIQLVAGTVGPICGLTTGGAIECDVSTDALPDDVYTAVGVDFGWLCGLGTAGVACANQSTALYPSALAIDRGAALMPGGVLAFAATTVDPSMTPLQLPGDFVEVTGGYFDACGQRVDGGWSCLNPAHEEAIAAHDRLDDVELAMGVPHDAEANGCGLDADGYARCWGRLRDRERSFEQLSIGTMLRADVLVHAEIPYACGVRDDGTLECWGPIEGWCDDSLCAADHYCEDGACQDCGPGGCDSCGDVTCSDGDHCAEPGVCRDCAGGNCDACECDASDPFCDVELSLCLCGTQCDAGTCRYACSPAQLTCGTVFDCSDGPPVQGECVDGWCVE